MRLTKAALILSALTVMLLASTRSFPGSRPRSWHRPRDSSRIYCLFRLTGRFQCEQGWYLSVLVGSLLILSTGGPDPVRAVASQTAVAAATNAKIWVGRQQEIEEFLKTAQIVRMEDIGLGVTKPKKAYLAPGGPVEAMTWKAIKPGTYSGYYESYKSEIVAYELDKLLGSR